MGRRWGGLTALLAVGLGNAPLVARAADVPTPAAASDGGPGELEGPMHPAAQALYDRALKGFETHGYPGAIRDLEAGFALDPRREFLFAEAQAKRLGGDCRGAVVLYQRFLTTRPPALQVDATQIALARCAQELANKPEVVVVTPPPPPPPQKPPPPRWSRDPWGLGLAGAGAIGLGVGVGFLVAAEVALGDARDATIYDGYAGHRSTAGTRLDVAVGALAIGGALATAGVVRLLFVRRRARAEASAVWIAPGAIGGTF